MLGRRSALAVASIAIAGLTGCSDRQLLNPPTPDQNRTRDVAASQAPASQDVIPDQYIIVFNDDVQNPAQLARSLVATHNGTLRHTYQFAIKGFSAVLPAAAPAALERNPQVAFVEQNALSYIDTHPRLEEIRAAAAVAAAATGRAVARGTVVGFNGLASIALVPPLAPPDPVTASAASASQIDVAWTDNSKGETGTELQRQAGAGGWQDLGDFGPDVTGYSDTNVAVGTTYCYQARVYKEKGKKAREYSDWSTVDASSCAAPSSGSTAPDAPSGLVATAVSSSQIDLTWMDNSSNEDDFEIERCTGTVASCGPSDYGNIATVGVGTTNFSDVGRAAATTYSYRVRATNGFGSSGYSDPDDATTSGAPAPPDGDPTNLVATTASTSRLDLMWNDGASNEDGYQIWRCTGTAAACDDSGLANYSEIDQTGSFAGSGAYSDGGLSAGADYSYLVRAFNTDGTSSFSNEASARTQDAQPGQCPDNGVHDATSGSGDYGINAVQAKSNDTWLGVRGNGPDCQIQAEFFGLDTGVDSDHPDLNVVEIQCFLAGTPGCTGEDGHGHGTHTAGTAAALDGGPNGGVVGVAPGAGIHGYKVCTDSGSCPNDDIIAGIDAVTAFKNINPGIAIVANMSLGGGANNAMDAAVRRSVNAGITYSLSAGNGVIGACLIPYDAQFVSPARTGDDAINASNGSNGDTRRVNGVLTTTSHSANFGDVNCNYGNPVTIAAPGNGIRSTWLNGGYNTISGTSMAAPHSAGAALLYLQDPILGSTPTDVENALCGRTLPWTTNDLPNAEGRLNVDGLGSDPADAANQPTGSSTCS